MSTDLKTAPTNLKIIEPTSEQEVAEVLEQANRDGLAVLPRGGGTKTEWGNAPARADMILSTARLNRVLEHAWADLTVTVEAGCTFGELQNTLKQHGQRLALDPMWPEHATIGGILSTNDTGSLRLRYGGLRDLVIGVTLALADGTLASSGGKVVKNVAGYDLPKLVTGALGTLGVITKAVFRLHPMPKNVQNVTLNASNVRDLERIVLKILDSDLVPAAVQVRADRKTAPQLDIQFEGTLEGIGSQMKKLAEMGSLAPESLLPASSDVWTRLDADAKISILPTQIAETLTSINGEAVIEATGLGWFKQDEGRRSEGIRELRKRIEGGGGSLVLLRHCDGLDAWTGGAPGSAVEMMRAVKRQFDPKNTLNPGRFLNGI